MRWCWGRPRCQSTRCSGSSRSANILELDATEDDAVHILVNNFPVAKGTVVVSGNKIAVEVNYLLPRTPDGVTL